MVKLQTICRDKSKYLQQNSKEIVKTIHNTHPSLHPFQKEREYQRALSSAKLERIMAKPFIAALDCHTDTVDVLSKSKNSLSAVASGSHNGEVILWDISKRIKLHNINAHEGTVSGITFLDGEIFGSCGEDKIIKFWSQSSLDEQASGENHGSYTPLKEFGSKTSLSGIDHNYSSSLFATGGEVVQVWDYERAQPTQRHEWGTDTVVKVKFNPTENNILLGTSLDRGIILYDIRGKTTLGKTTLQNRSNAICWNPYEPMNFVVGNEDSNCYTFDMRKLEKAKMIHKGHVGAVTDIDFAPTGKEFVTGGYDKTIRIFRYNEGKSREIYHTQRMHFVYSVLFTLDSSYVLSGSTDANIRVWKSNASMPIKPVYE